jgi:hypothetical protein
MANTDSQECQNLKDFVIALENLDDTVFEICRHAIKIQQQNHDRNSQHTVIITEDDLQSLEESRKDHQCSGYSLMDMLKYLARTSEFKKVWKDAIISALGLMSKYYHENSRNGSFTIRNSREQETVQGNFPNHV